MTKLLFARILIKLEFAIESENKKLWKKYGNTDNIPLIGLTTCYVPVKHKNKEVEMAFFDINVNFKSEKFDIQVLNMHSVDNGDDTNLLHKLRDFDNSKDVAEYVSKQGLPILKENIKLAIDFYDSLKCKIH